MGKTKTINCLSFVISLILIFTIFFNAYACGSEDCTDSCSISGAFQKGSEFGDRYIQSYISYIAGGALAVVTNTWWIGLIASIGTKVFCKFGRLNFSKAKSLDNTIGLNEKILKRMREKIKYAL